MASIRKIAQDVLDDVRCGVAWIALYKEGRGWDAETFCLMYDEPNGVFIADELVDTDRLDEILSIDPNAILVNVDYNNLGPGPGDGMTRDTLAAALRWQYDIQRSRLADAVIQRDAEDGADVGGEQSSETPDASEQACGAEQPGEMLNESGQARGTEQQDAAQSVAVGKPRRDDRGAVP